MIDKKLDEDFDRHFLGTDDIEWSKSEIESGTWTIYAYAAKKYMRKTIGALLSTARKEVIEEINDWAVENN